MCMCVGVTDEAALAVNLRASEGGKYLVLCAWPGVIYSKQGHMSGVQIRACRSQRWSLGCARTGAARATPVGRAVGRPADASRRPDRAVLFKALIMFL